MKYTVRYAHLKDIPTLEGLVKEGEIIGVMGNTGQSYGAHLHIDCVRGLQYNNWKLADVENGHMASEIRQLNYFIDNELFKQPYRITTYYCDPEYINNKLHFAYDIVPIRGDWTIYWNRSKIGQVLAKGYDDSYGNYILIGFEA
jgi:hypothetical protein